MPDLFKPLKLRSLTLPNRIGMSPMCQYSAKDGIATDWHFVHYGSRAVSGLGLIFVEATAISPKGRISSADMGLWSDAHTEPLARIASFAKSQGCAVGIQLAHAGRKAGVTLGWEAQRALTIEEGGWPAIAPSPLPFDEGFNLPHELDEAGIRNVIDDYAAAARRASEAGFDVVEVHAAHGYLLHEFLSPLFNKRTDQYGGSLENRSRLLREVIITVHAEWPHELPVFVRLSATDWVKGGWDISETVELCRMLKTLGVDLVDVSSAGLVPTAQIPFGPGFQTPFAARIRHEADIPVATVGLITAAAQADHIIRTGQADLVLLGRELLRNPYWALHAARELGHPAVWPSQYLRAVPPGTSGR